MTYTRLSVSIIAALVVSVLCAGYAPAAERIVSFDSDITVNPDSTMTVTETITVEAEGRDIRRGIYRDFPTEYKTPSGRRYVTSFDVLEVTRDGSPEEHFVKRMQNGWRLYIGDKYRLLQTGEHTYTITYNTDRQLGYFDTHDELYWNVTGNGWAFTISSATATVHPPPGASVERVRAYTGGQGERGYDYDADINPDGSASFSTTRTLGVHQGLTVVAAWQKGFVSEPAGLTKLAHAWRDTRHIVIALLCIAVVLMYYSVAWLKVGRDPLGGHIVVQYDPPDGLSPAAMRHIYRRGYDDKAFTAAVVDLAVKGFIEIRQPEEDEYELFRTGKDAVSTGTLSPGERKVFKRLFGHARKHVKLGEYKAYIGEAVEDLKELLGREYSEKYFLRNIEYTLPGIALSILGVAWCYHELYFLDGDFYAFALIALLGTPVMMFLWAMFAGSWSEFLSAKNLVHFVRSVIATVFFLAGLAGYILVWALMFGETAGVSALALALVTVNALFFYIMDAPTVMGRMVMDRIEGFRVFLKATEEDRLNLLNPPERTPELFESLLPYAMALDCENEWAEQFGDAVMQSAIAEKASAWYTGSHLHGERFTSSLTGSLTSSLGGAIASSSIAPGSSSGFSGGGGGFSGGGGGGFSGGGGGGGGGGGW